MWRFTKKTLKVSSSAAAKDYNETGSHEGPPGKKDQRVTSAAEVKFIRVTNPNW